MSDFSLTQRYEDGGASKIVYNSNNFGLHLEYPSSTLHVGGDVRIEDDLKVKKGATIAGGVRISNYGEGGWTPGKHAWKFADAQEVRTHSEATRATLGWCCNMIMSIQDGEHKLVSRDDLQHMHDSVLHAVRQETRLACDNIREECMQHVATAVQDMWTRVATEMVDKESANIQYVTHDTLTMYPTMTQAQASFMRTNAGSNFMTVRDAHRLFAPSNVQQVNRKKPQTQRK
jgi:hypothetical protein